MDGSDTPLIDTSRIAGAMNYPSTTQALFALIVMIIVLLFILVYCCWGTFSCARQDDASHHPDEGAAVVREIQGPGGRSNRMVIVPFSNMIYVGDPESRRIYEIPVEQDKPPAYTEVPAYDGIPPPPYSTNNQGRDTPSTDSSNNASNTRPSLPDLPPSYEDCLSTTANSKWPEVLEALMAEQAKQQLRESNQTQSEETLVTQLPALRMPSMLLAQNDMLSNLETRSPLTENDFASSDTTSSTTEPDDSPLLSLGNQTPEDGQSPSEISNLLDPWTSSPTTRNQNVAGESESAIPSPFPPAYTVTPTQNQNLTGEEDSTPNNENLLPSSVTISTSSDSSNSNGNHEINFTQSFRESSHSRQDYSDV